MLNDTADSEGLSAYSSGLRVKDYGLSKTRIRD
jgi:hypothetical protein